MPLLLIKAITALDFSVFSLCRVSKFVPSERILKEKRPTSGMATISPFPETLKVLPGYGGYDVAKFIPTYATESVPKIRATPK